MPALRDVWWMAAPLAAKNRVDFNQDLDRSWGDKKGLRIPSTAKESLTKFYHWALQVGDMCYEVSPNDKCKGLGIFIDLCIPHPCPADEWHQRYVGVHPQVRKVGQTRKTHEEIMATVDEIWTDFNQERYDFLIQNCQNFVGMLCAQVLVSKDDPEVVGAEDWKPVPEPVGHRLADGSMAVVIGGTTYATYAAYLKALTTVIEAGQMGNLGATGVAATNIEEATVGLKGASGVAGSAIKGSAATGTTAAKAGLSAKMAGFGLHAAGVTKAAAVGGGMLRAGAYAVYFHPVAGAAVAGVGAGLVYVGTRGKRDQKWTEEHDAQSETSDFAVNPETMTDDADISVEGIMAMEVMALEHAEASQVVADQPIIVDETAMESDNPITELDDADLDDADLDDADLDNADLEATVGDEVSKQRSQGQFTTKSALSIIREWRKKKLAG